MMIKGVRAAAARSNAFHSSRSGDFVGSQVFKRDTASMGLPPRSQWIASAMVRKRVVIETTAWQERRITLTSDYLFLSRTEGREVAESIPLTEISAVDSLRTTQSTEEPEDEKVLGRRLKRSDSSKSGPKSGPQLKATRSLRPAASLRSPVTAVGEEEMFLFEIRTKFDGWMNGRTYCIRFISRQECDEWIELINKAMKDMFEDRSPTWRVKVEQVRSQMERLYLANVTQAVIAFFIVGNFVTSIIEAELNPEIGTRTHDALQTIGQSPPDLVVLTGGNRDYCFTGLFTIELLLNMFVNWWTPFIQDGWNIFDFVVVTASLITAPFSNVPGFTVLRFLRVFRVIRLFRRLAVLHVLIKALSASIIPVIHAFMILLIVTCLYSIIAVVLFAESSPDKFGSFSSSLFTMFQVCTGDGWATTIARPLLEEKGESAFTVAAFFVSYILVGGTFLINIVVAVLLDEFISSVEESRAIPLEVVRKEHEAEFVKHESPLDPLVATLTSFASSDDLDQQISQIYQMLDTDKAGLSSQDGLSYEQLRQGLHRLHFNPRIHLTPDDFEEITHNQTLCNALGEVDQEHFTKIMRMQLFRFTQKYLSLKMMDASDDQFSVLVAIKQLLLLNAAASTPDLATSEQSPWKNLETMLGGLGDRIAGIEVALGLSHPNSSQPTPHDTSVEDCGATPELFRHHSSTGLLQSSPRANVLARHPSPIATSPMSPSRRRTPSLEMIAELRGEMQETPEKSPVEAPLDKRNGDDEGTHDVDRLLEEDEDGTTDEEEQGGDEPREHAEDQTNGQVRHETFQGRQTERYLDDVGTDRGHGVDSSMGEAKPRSVPAPMPPPPHPTAAIDDPQPSTKTIRLGPLAASEVQLARPRVHADHDPLSSIHPLAASQTQQTKASIDSFQLADVIPKPKPLPTIPTSPRQQRGASEIRAAAGADGEADASHTQRSKHRPSPLISTFARSESVGSGERARGAASLEDGQAEAQLVLLGDGDTQADLVVDTPEWVGIGTQRPRPS